ncbi:hypothetical protein JKP88DRAFT_274163 [Tribonema minus]|uniref:Replication origin-binding protein n=1 Tax=Tribonema minus TaxID=303371 RepID=A0A835YUS9_9STRA|nr:hypothetical protein JKP88DRAFT_274163 [Tribonema minus]
MRCELPQPNPDGWTTFDWFDVRRLAAIWLNIEVLKAYMTEVWAKTGKWIRRTRQDKAYLEGIDSFEQTFETIKRLHAAFNGSHTGIAGSIRTVYKRAKRIKFGRVYATGPTLQMMNKILRRWLTSEILRDFDFCNCHPSILHDLCVRHGIDAPLLRGYVLEPSAIRTEIGSDGKTKVLAAIYMDRDRTRGQWLIDFGMEIDRVVAAFEDIYKEDYDELKRHYDRDNIRGAFMARILQQYEAGLLKIVTEKVMSWGVHIAAFIFDGFMIRKRLEGEDDEGTDASLPADYMAQLNALVHRAGFPSVSLEEKPIEAIDFEEYARLNGLQWTNPAPVQVRRALSRIPDSVIDNFHGGVLKIDSSMSSGKSYQMRRLIARSRSQGLRVLILTSRQLLASTWKGEIERELSEFKHELTFYQDAKRDKDRGKMSAASDPILILEQESLMHAFVYGYEVVIIDEARSAASTIVSTTNGEHGSRIADHYIQIHNVVTSAQYVVGLDADFTVDGAADLLMRRFAAWRNEILQEYVHDGGSMVRTVRINSENVLLSQMCRQAQQGLTFGVCCGSKKMARKIYHMLVGIVGAEHIRLYTAEDGDASDLENVDLHWANRIVIYTSRITTGISFNRKEGDGAASCIYVFPCAKTASAREMWQMTGRFRNLVTGIIYLSCNETTAGHASISLLRIDVDRQFEQQMQSLKQSTEKMKRDGVAAVNAAVAIADADRLRPVADWKSYDLITALRAYDAVERATTISITQWIRFFRYMARLKGYDVFDDYARGGHVDLERFYKAAEYVEEVEIAKMATVKIDQICDKMEKTIKSLSRNTFVSQEDMARLLIFEEETGVTPGWNHVEASNKLRIKASYPEIAAEDITPHAVRILDTTASKRLNVALVQSSSEAYRQYLGIIERTRSSIPNLIPGVGVLLRDMHQLAVAIGLEGVLDFENVPDLFSDGRRILTAIKELRAGNGIRTCASDTSTFIRNAFEEVFGIVISTKPGPNKMHKDIKAADAIARFDLDTALRANFSDERQPRDERTSHDDAVRQLKDLIDAMGPNESLQDAMNVLRAQGSKRKRT